MRNYKLFLGVLMFSITPMFGQGYYDDDIYYDAEKAKKERQEKLAELHREKYSGRKRQLLPLPERGGKSCIEKDHCF